MPLTRYPNGLTVNSTTALVYNTACTDSIGGVDCLNLFVQGTTSTGVLSATTITVTNVTATNVTVSTAGRFSIGTTSAATMIGERVYIPFSFTSATATTYYASPIAGNIIDCWVVADTTPRTCSAFTLYANGTAGTVVVASVATLVYATAIGQQVQPALTPATQGVATGLAIVVTTAGSAVNFQGVVVIQRTA